MNACPQEQTWSSHIFCDCHSVLSPYLMHNMKYSSYCAHTMKQNCLDLTVLLHLNKFGPVWSPIERFVVTKTYILMYWPH